MENNMHIYCMFTLVFPQAKQVYCIHHANIQETYYYIVLFYTIYVYIIIDQHYTTSSNFLHYKELYTVCWSVNFLP